MNHYQYNMEKLLIEKLTNDIEAYLKKRNKKDTVFKIKKPERITMSKLHITDNDSSKLLTVTLHTNRQFKLECAESVFLEINNILNNEFTKYYKIRLSLFIGNKTRWKIATRSYEEGKEVERTTKEEYFN